MKYLKLIITLTILITIASCKKAYVFTQADLVGTWTETQPYLFNNGHYILQFNANDTVIRYGFSSGFGADTPVVLYKLFNNNSLQMDQSVAGQGYTGNMTYQINGDANNLTIVNFVSTLNTQNNSFIWHNINFIKN
jgi:hypothetical protein